MWVLWVALLAQPQWVDCGCVCVDGVPKTLCQSIEEARGKPRLCVPEHKCPLPEQIDPAPQFFDTPDERAHNCREVRVWSAERNSHAGVRVCDVFTS